jgi:hypothetical protein
MAQAIAFRAFGAQDMPSCVFVPSPLTFRGFGALDPRAVGIIQPHRWIRFQRHAQFKPRARAVIR